MNHAPRRDRRLYARPVRQLFLFVLAVLLVAQLAVSASAWALTEHRFLPELERKAKVVGKALSGKLARAAGYGIPFDQLGGVPEFFDEILVQNPDLAYLDLTDASGKLLQRSARGARERAAGNHLDLATPVLLNGAVHGYVHVGIERSYLASRIQDLRYDIAIVLLASLMIAFEILLFVVTLNVSAPLRQVIEMMSRLADGDFARRAAAGGTRSLGERLNGIALRLNQGFGEVSRLAAPSGGAAAPLLQRLRTAYRFAEPGAIGELAPQRVVAVRILAFLFMFAEMLSRPFLPQYAAAAPGIGAALPEGLRASLPVTAFLLGVALSMPFAGRWSDQVGRRTSYLAGALCIAAGLAATALLPDYLALVAARALTGIGYAIMFMSCQGFVFDQTERHNSGRGMAMFVGAIMVAEICAPAVGGILADRIGQAMVFLIGAAVAVAAALLAARVLERSPATAAAPPRPRLRLAALASNRRFLALSLLSGVPAKFLYSGFLIFLVPLLLTELGSSKSEIGRYTMIYGLTAVALAPLFARLADKYDAYAAMVAGGGLLTGLGLLPIAGDASPQLVLLGIGLLGLGQSMSISAQLVLVARATGNEARAAGTGPVLGMFRLVERLGAAAGPVATGVLVAAWGARQAALALGLFALAASLLFALAYAASAARDRQAGSAA